MQNMNPALTSNEILSYVEEIGQRKKFKNISVDKFYIDILDNKFSLNGQSYGIDLITQFHPVVFCKIEKINPTIVDLKIIPDYNKIGFFTLVAAIFIFTAIFIDELTIGDTLKTPTLLERFYFSLGGIIPVFYCYFLYIKPIKTMKIWVIDSFQLIKQIPV